MKNQFVGDKFDFYKYGLLRFFMAECSFRVDVHWMLTPDVPSNHGRKLHYLNDPDKYRISDPDLYDLLLELDPTNQPGNRNITYVERNHFLPGASFYGTPISVNSHQRQKDFNEFLDTRAVGNDLVFFDPDNGLAPKSMKTYPRSKSINYLTIDELDQTFGRGHSVLVYQHFSRENHATFMAKKVDTICSGTNCRESQLIIFETKEVAFILILQPSHLTRIRPAMGCLRRKWGNIICISTGVTS
ncbi:MAG: hypothetical protein HQK56_13140 [Deltaproteobacteria bacterium]|nr:hypothetical protein [Deltaproteobacteria bacterium]